MKTILSLISLCLVVLNLNAQKTIQSSDHSEWWKRNNLRVIQCNLPAYEAANIDADSITQDLIDFSANTLIINAGGIMAFYETELPFHYKNPFMKPGELGKIIDRCHEHGIRVVVRFDFSRADESIYNMHPDWFYISQKGKHIINTDKYVVCINAPYVQEKSFLIIEELIDKFDIDGIFLNMPGYSTSDHYENEYHGIDQNDFDKAAFAKWSNGLVLPLEENSEDPVFVKYQQFKNETVTQWSQKLHERVKSKNKKIAICTYLEDYVDIIRHESQTRELPYWPYSASDNTNHIEQSFPNKIVSNASIQQISFQSRYNAIEPEELTIRLVENIANGSGTDVSLMGDLRDYEDQRNFGAMKKIYGHHKKWESYYGKYQSLAKIAVIAPGYWPGGETMKEYRGIQMMLKEAHIQFDIIQQNQIAKLQHHLSEYQTIILPDIYGISDADVQALKDIAESGTSLLATNNSLLNHKETIKRLFGAVPVEPHHDGSGNYVQPKNKDIFYAFEGQSMVHIKFNLGLYTFDDADNTFLPILSKGRPGPPEMIGGHDPTGYYAMGQKGNNILMPFNIGKLYYIHGYEQHKELFLNSLAQVAPTCIHQIKTNAPARVELVLQDFMYNTEGVYIETPFKSDGHILHLINLMGFSGNTYFDAPEVTDLEFEFKVDFKPQKLHTMQQDKDIDFTYAEGIVSFQLDRLSDFESIILYR